MSRPLMRFDAAVHSTPRGRGGAFVELPDDAAEVFGTRARFPVKVTFNGIRYRGSTMPIGDGRFCVGIAKAIRQQLGVEFGDMVAVVVELDEDERTVDTPAELRDALTSAQLTTRFDSMAFTHRKEYARWIAEAKKPESRRRRVQQAVEMIRAGRRFS